MFARVPSAELLNLTDRRPRSLSKASYGSSLNLSINSLPELLSNHANLSPKSKKHAAEAVLLATFVTALTAATLGYDVGVMADAIPLITAGFNLDIIRTQLVVGSLNIIAAFGTLIAGHTADWLGRKVTVGICCGLYVVGTAFMAFANGFYLLLLGRIITGLGVGVSFVVTPVYIAEITPSEVRGMLATSFDISINVGILLGYTAGYFVSTSGYSDEIQWRLMLGLGMIVPIFVLIGLTKLPESPRWLMVQGLEDEALVVLENFLGSHELAQETTQDIRELVKDELGQDPLTWTELFFPHKKYLQDIIYLVLGMGFWQQATGSEALLYYSDTFLIRAGLESKKMRLLGYIGLGLCKMLPEMMVMFRVDELGRRPFIISSSLAVTAIIFACALSFVLQFPACVVVILLCAYMAAFSAGVGPLTWLVASECLPHRQRAKGMTLCSFVNRFMSGAVALSTLSTCDALGYAGFFTFYACVSASATLFYFLYVTETKGRTLEEITALYLSRAGEEFRPIVLVEYMNQIDGAKTKPLVSQTTPSVMSLASSSPSAMSLDVLEF